MSGGNGFAAFCSDYISFPKRKRLDLMGVKWTIGAEAANAILVSGQVIDAAGRDLPYRTALGMYLSDDANGDSVVATAPDGTIAIGTDGLLSDVGVVNNKNYRLVTEADGDFDVSIGESGVKSLYMVIILPHGALAVSPVITFA
jgi:hypothetical protein